MNDNFSVEEVSPFNENKEIIKVMLVGDGAVGKTALVCSFAYGISLIRYMPTVYETHSSGK